MPLLFPEQFDPTTWRGRRARAFPGREDAFQQLVGHALQETWGSCAHITPTAGRDGSIDAWVEDVGDRAESGFDLRFPLAVECKYHDPEARHPSENLHRGWQRVRAKLQRQAVAGWPGDFAPWRNARGYLYCVSVRLHNQATREALKLEIQGFFDGLPAEHRPPVEAVRLLDWGDLRTWFDRHPRLAYSDEAGHRIRAKAATCRSAATHEAQVG